MPPIISPSLRLPSIASMPSARDSASARTPEFHNSERKKTFDPKTSASLPESADSGRCKSACSTGHQILSCTAHKQSMKKPPHTKNIKTSAALKVFEGENSRVATMPVFLRHSVENDLPYLRLTPTLPNAASNVADHDWLTIAL